MSSANPERAYAIQKPLGLFASLRRLSKLEQCGRAPRRQGLDEIVGAITRLKRAGAGAPLTIESPTDGMLRALSAQPGQVVPAGGALFEIVDLSRMWIRVPVYVGDQSELAAEEDADVVPLASRPGPTSQRVRPVAAPPSANLLAGTVDLYYELANAESPLAPGQRVGVNIPLIGEADSLTLPWSAVVHDIHGGTWVYEMTAEHTFVRRRIVVRFTRGELAVLNSGPAVGAKVVTAGAAELFGTEVGFSK